MADVIPMHAVIVTTREEANRRLLEMSTLQARQARIEADRDRELAQVREKFDKLMQVEVEGGAKVSIVDRLKQLDDALTLYGKDRRAELLPGKGKTATFPHGAIAYRGHALALDPIADHERSKTLLERCRSAIARALADVVVGVRALNAGEILKPVKVEVDASAILRLHKVKEFSAEDLEKLGFTVAPDGETITVKPSMEASPKAA